MNFLHIHVTALVYIPLETKTDYPKCRKNFIIFEFGRNILTAKIYFSAAIQKSLDNADEIDFDNWT